MCNYHCNAQCCRCACRPCTPCCPPYPPCPPPVFATLTAVKQDALTGLPLSGARYGLFRDGNLVQEHISGANGSMPFVHILPGTYTLREIAAPAGYAPNATIHTVLVDCSGAVLVDGSPATTIAVQNFPSTFTFAFMKFADTDPATPLPGAEFTLYANGQPAATAVSNAAGQVSFSAIAPGTYTMQETTVPAGYEPNPTIYTVTIQPDGVILINGAPILGFSVTNTAVTP